MNPPPRKLLHTPAKPEPLDRLLFWRDGWSRAYDRQWIFYNRQPGRHRREHRLRISQRRMGTYFGAQ